MVTTKMATNKSEPHLKDMQRQLGSVVSVIKVRVWFFEDETPRDRFRSTISNLCSKKPEMTRDWLH